MFQDLWCSSPQEVEGFTECGVHSTTCSYVNDVRSFLVWPRVITRLDLAIQAVIKLLKFTKALNKYQTFTRTKIYVQLNICKSDKSSFFILVKFCILNAQRMESISISALRYTLASDLPFRPDNNSLSMHSRPLYCTISTCTVHTLLAVNRVHQLAGLVT